MNPSVLWDMILYALKQLLISRRPWVPTFHHKMALLLAARYHEHTSVKSNMAHFLSSQSPSFLSFLGECRGTVPMTT
ncbi:hypothetical protein ACMX2I_01395 [Bacillus sp. SW14]|uniref:hypothetical protein n=1 Tax=Bacillus sp. SW14 TaxID=3391618 RepID=UPI0039E36A2C